MSLLFPCFPFSPRRVGGNEIHLELLRKIINENTKIQFVKISWGGRRRSVRSSACSTVRSATSEPRDSIHRLPHECDRGFSSLPLPLLSGLASSEIGRRLASCFGGGRGVLHWVLRLLFVEGVVHFLDPCHRFGFGCHMA
jgi:hypothetical protein